MKTLNLIFLTLPLLLLGCNGEDEILNTPGPAPVIIAISPEKGKSGTTVKITGQDFGTTPSENAVSFNGVAASVFDASATELTVEVPNEAGSGVVEVTVKGQKAVGPQFTWLPDNGRYVNGVNGNDQNGANNCEDPDFPCSTISQAIAVSFGGDFIEIADAEYTESLTINKPLILRGESEANTIVQAHERFVESQARVITIEEGIEVSISDLTVRNGRAKGNFPNTIGGGIYTRAGSFLTLLNITFSKNEAVQGGGMYNTRNSNTLTNVTFQDNQAETGGGIYNDNSSPILNNVVFSNNSALFGGGMHSRNVSSPSLNNVDFAMNFAEFSGGGIHNFGGTSSLTNVTFNNNVAGESGGGMYNEGGTPTLIDVNFISNVAGIRDGPEENGGGMYNELSDPLLTGVLFENNQARDHGGGMYNYISNPVLTDVQFIENVAQLGGGMSNVDSSPTVTNVIFNENKGNLHGGGMRNENESSPFLTNVVFWKNQATQGGAMFNRGASAPLLVNVTFGGNIATIGGGLVNFTGSKPTLLNSIVWGNTAGTANEIYNGNQGAISIHFSLFRDGAADITAGAELVIKNFLTIDPLFVDPEGGDFQLQDNSPAINAGDTTTDLSIFPGGPDSPTDLDENPRVFDGRIDIGAYENQNN